MSGTGLSADFIEAALAMALVSAGLVFPKPGRQILVALHRVLRPLERRPKLAILLAGILPVVLRLVLLIWHPEPHARTMEEHNNLLQADTYAHWRLANPMHPLAVVLQSYQVIQWPHYMSSRPPLSSLFLFVGQVLFDSPFLGNLLGVGLVSACLCWMLLGWVPRRWAVLGSVVAICQFTIFGYWTNSYWAPTVPVLGGGLLLGLVPRIENNSTAIHALLLAVGTALLAGTRPFEGFICFVIVGLWLLIRFVRREQRSQLFPRLRTFVVPAMAGGILIVLGQLGYNQATTGKATLMPYQIWRASQTSVPPFLWQPISREPLTFYYEGARLFAKWEIGRVAPLHEGTMESYARLLGRHASTLREVVGFLLIIPLLCWSSTWFSREPRRRDVLLLGLGSWAVIYALYNANGLYRGIALLIVMAVSLRWRDGKYRLPLLLVLGGGVATNLSSFYMENYFLPFVPALLVLIVTGLRNLHAWDRVRGTGSSLGGFLVLGCGAMLLIQIGASALGRPLYGRSDLGRFDFKLFKEPAEIANKLERVPGKHLILARHEDEGNSTRELVWNLADIDSQKIVWARDLKAEWSAAAANYYADRKVWLLQSSPKHGPMLTPYPLNRLPPPAPLSSLPIPDMPHGCRE